MFLCAWRLPSFLPRVVPSRRSGNQNVAGAGGWWGDRISGEDDEAKQTNKGESFCKGDKHTSIYSWEITVHKLFTAVGTPAHGRPTVAGPTGRQGPSGRSPAVGTYEGWVTSYGVCGHLLDSLSAWGHSVTLFKPEQAHFGRFYGIMFFRKASPQTEGRRHAHPQIKT